MLAREGLGMARNRGSRLPADTQLFAAAANRTGWGARISRAGFAPGRAAHCCDHERCPQSVLALRCQAVEKTDTPRVLAIFAAAFGEHGMPETIRSDKGSAFAARAVNGVSGYRCGGGSWGSGRSTSRPGTRNRTGGNLEIRVVRVSDANSSPFEQFIIKFGFLSNSKLAGGVWQLYGDNGMQEFTWPGRTAETELALEIQKAALRREFWNSARECGTLAFRVARGVLRNAADAEDVAQEAMLRAYRRFARLRDPSRFRAWLVRISFRLALDHGRPRDAVERRETVRATEPARTEPRGHGCVK